MKNENNVFAYVVGWVVSYVVYEMPTTLIVDCKTVDIFMLERPMMMLSVKFNACDKN
mgnify:CR=1 FL=1